MTLVEQMTQMLGRVDDDYIHFNELLSAYRVDNQPNTKEGLEAKLDSLETILVEGASVQSQIYLLKYFVLTKVMKEMPASALAKLKVRLAQLDELKDGLRSVMFPLVEASKSMRERHFEMLEESKKNEFKDE